MEVPGQLVQLSWEATKADSIEWVVASRLVVASNLLVVATTGSAVDIVEYKEQAVDSRLVRQVSEPVRPVRHRQVQVQCTQALELCKSELAHLSQTMTKVWFLYIVQHQTAQRWVEG